MTVKRVWGILVPVLTTVLVLGIVFFVSPRPSIGRGIFVGMLLALAQSFLSTVSMHLAWKKPYFYWVWGGGVLFRMVVFAATAFVVYQFTALSIVATLISMVTATTFFLVVETLAFLDKK